MIRKKRRDLREIQLLYKLKRFYGLTLDAFVALNVKQNGRCAICGDPPSKGTVQTSRLHVDHSHKSKRVRGLLCNTCNRALGLFKDDPSILRAAAHYIERGEK